MPAVNLDKVLESAAKPARDALTELIAQRDKLQTDHDAKLTKLRDDFNAKARPLETDIVRAAQALERITGKWPREVPRQSTPARSGRRSRATGRPSASQIDEAAIVKFVKANQPVGASEIGKAVGAGGNPLTTKLKKLADSGALRYEGERRQRVYSIA